VWFLIVPALAALGVAGWFGFERSDWRTWVGCLDFGIGIYLLFRKVVMPALFRMAVLYPERFADEEAASPG